MLKYWWLTAAVRIQLWQRRQKKEGVLVGAAAVVIAAKQFPRATAKGAGWAGKVPLQGCAVGVAACRVSDRVSALLYLNGYTAQCRFLGGVRSGVVAGAGWRGMARGALAIEVAHAGRQQLQQPSCW